MGGRFYRLTVDIEATGTSEAWRVIKNLPSSFSISEVESGKFDKLKKFEIIEVLRQIGTEVERG